MDPLRIEPNIILEQVPEQVNNFFGSGNGFGSKLALFCVSSTFYTEIPQNIFKKETK